MRIQLQSIGAVLPEAALFPQNQRHIKPSPLMSHPIGTGLEKNIIQCGGESSCSDRKTQASSRPVGRTGPELPARCRQRAPVHGESGCEEPAAANLTARTPEDASRLALRLALLGALPLTPISSSDDGNGRERTGNPDRKRAQSIYHSHSCRPRPFFQR